MQVFIHIRTKETGGKRRTTMAFWVLLFNWGQCHGTGINAFQLIKDVVQPYMILSDVYPDEGHVTNVTLTFFPMHVISLKEREQLFTLSGWFRITWKDSNLQWKPHSYGNISRTFVAYDSIWKPDLTITNSAEKLQALTASPSSYLLLSSDGHVEWFPGNIFNVACKMDLSHFPFDHQDCFIQVSTWIYTAENVRLAPHTNPIRTDNWHVNYEWDMYHTYCDVYNHTSDGKQYPYVEYHFLLRRRSTFYVLKFLAPIVILSLLNAFVFCVPAESGEKVSLSVSTMLSLTVFLAYLTDITPSNSDTVPEIAIFVFLHLVLSALGVICNILLLKLHLSQQQEASKRQRKMTQKLWTSSVEEQDDPSGTLGHRKNTRETYWRSDVNDKDEEEKLQIPVRFSQLMDTHLFRQNSLAPNRDSQFRSHQTRNHQHSFHDVTRDRYLTFEIDGSSKRKRNRFVGSCDNLRHSGGSLSSKAGSHSSHSGLKKNCKNLLAGKCAVVIDYLDCICFVLFLLSSLLVSTLFFVRNA